MMSTNTKVSADGILAEILDEQIANVQMALQDGFQFFMDVPIYLSAVQFIIETINRFKDVSVEERADIIINTLKNLDAKFQLWEKSTKFIKYKVGFLWVFLKWFPGLRKYLKSRDSFFESLRNFVIQKIEEIDEAGADNSNHRNSD